MASDLIMSDKMGDVILKVHHGGYSWRFPVHSLLLTAKSSKFREMIEERSNHEHPLSLTIIGTHPDTILALIRYIYTGECPENVTADLLVAAEKYDLTSLKDHMEEQLLPNLTVVQACKLLEEFENLHPLTADCAIKISCMLVIEQYAHRVFSSDLVLGLSRRTLLTLLESNKLNVPDESIVFWGIWRWGRRICSQNSRPLEDEAVAGFIEDMLVLIRVSSIRREEGIPLVASRSFNRCLPRRSIYQSPEDSLEQCTVLQTCGTWDDLTEVLQGDRGNLCLQVSFDKDVMLVGVTLEICAPHLQEAFIQVFRESDGKELSRQKINCFQCVVRKLSRSAEPEAWLQTDVVLSEPLLLPRVEIYSLYLRVGGAECLLPRSLHSSRRKRIQNVFASLHGQAAVAVRELHLMPDVKATWGP